MVLFPNCKINLGLTILDKREDGYHNLESVFLPIQLCDALEIVVSEKDELIIYGNKTDENPEKNTCFKALNIIRRVRKIPPVKIHLLKNIPMGAGLGGGSSDGAFTLLLLNKKFNLGLSERELVDFAMKIGSDCGFFIYNKPMFISGRGEIISPFEISLKGYTVAIAFPDVHVDTAFAFNQLTFVRNKLNPNPNTDFKRKLIPLTPEDWKDNVFNDFENIIFQIYPEIKKWKNYFYIQGAVFSLMSGSGSSVYAIFKNDSVFQNKRADLFRHKNVFMKDL